MIDKGTGCAACQYMHEAVTRVLKHFPQQIEYRRINLRTPEGRERFLSLCVGIYGREKVHRHLQLAPVPSMFMDDQLIFTTIPDMDRLQTAIIRRLP